MPESRDPNLSLTHFLPYRLAKLAQNISENFSQVYQREANLTSPRQSGGYWFTLPSMTR